MALTKQEMCGEGTSIGKDRHWVGPGPVLVQWVVSSHNRMRYTGDTSSIAVEHIVVAPTKLV